MYTTRRELAYNLQETALPPAYGKPVGRGSSTSARYIRHDWKMKRKLDTRGRERARESGVYYALRQNVSTRVHAQMNPTIRNA